MNLKQKITCTCISFTLIAISGCSGFKYSPFPKFGGKIEGYAWCSSRYLDMVDAYQTPPRNPSGETARKLRLAKDGYVYALAATLTLQHDDAKNPYNFGTPAYLKSIPELTEHQWNGFQAETFSYRNQTTGQNELIIAFRGSDQLFIDYFFQNFAVWQLQNKPAREYVKKAVEYRNSHRELFGDKVVVTGNSLGGGLAAHVTNHQETGGMITEAWAFNPSPRPGVSAPDGGNPKIRLLSTSSEVLNISNRRQIGAQPQNRYTGFNLIESSSIYNHYRWVLAREILWYADLALYFEKNTNEDDSEPLKIIRSQSISDANCAITEKRIASDRAEYNHRLPTASGASRGVIPVDETTAVDKILNE
ncbi:DUF2974 domain-containing protein [Pseudomonas sp. FP2196]|uniref:Mbeg1-like protein n=1 Tax=Pseudomonas sp. FP2196 TaxID=2954086 RepID=UPI0027338335|nr:Mbeg1-like protein [Pseudomonas sp. FP2196]WLH34308.1 DUF2974 domain-containing protein [Pseudomonas sp. FP2196]